MSSAKGWILTVVRIALGVIFLVHGIAKMQMGLGNVAQWFESIGLPGGLGYFTAIAELLGGAALIAGIGTRYISALFVLIMLGAIVKAKWSLGLMGDGKAAGYELELALALICLALVADNKQSYGLDRVLFGKAGRSAS